MPADEGRRTKDGPLASVEHSRSVVNGALPFFRIPHQARSPASSEFHANAREEKVPVCFNVHSGRFPPAKMTDEGLQWRRKTQDA